MNRLRRSRRVLWLAAFLAFALIAAACDDSPGDVGATTVVPTTTSAGPVATSTAPPATTAAPSTTAGPLVKPYGGEAVVGRDLEQEPATLNPFLPGGDKLFVAIIGQGYLAGVQEIDGATLDLVPELVTELPTKANGGVTINEDGTMTVRYQIRDEARWSDGIPITGGDFQFTLDTILDPDVPFEKDTYEDIIDTQVGPKTFQYTLLKPNVGFELLFGTIIPKHAVEGSDFVADWNDTMWPSAGPFILDSWQKGEFLKLVRNNNYWKHDPETGQPLPYLDSVVFRFIQEPEFVSDAELLVDGFINRQFDIINPALGRLDNLMANVVALQALEPDGVRVEVLSGPFWEHLTFSFGPGRLERNPDSANDNLNYRKAVAHAINKDLIVDEILSGQVEPLDSFVEQYIPTLSQGSWAQYDYNVDKAKEFVEAAKAELGVDELFTVFSSTSNVYARVRASELFVGMFADVGITYVNQLEVSQLYFGETLPDGNWDLGAWSWIGAPGLSGLVGILNEFDPSALPEDPFNTYRWGTEGSSVIDDNTARFDIILEAINGSVDPDLLEPLIMEAENILADQAVIIPLYARLDPGAVWADTIGGFKHNPTSAGFTWNMEEWYHLQSGVNTN